MFLLFITICVNSVTSVVFLQNDQVVKQLIGIRRSQARLEETRYWLLSQLYQLPETVRSVAVFLVFYWTISLAN